MLGSCSGLGSCAMGTARQGHLQARRYGAGSMLSKGMITICMQEHNFTYLYFYLPTSYHGAVMPTTPTQEALDLMQYTHVVCGKRMDCSPAGAPMGKLPEPAPSRMEWEGVAQELGLLGLGSRIWCPTLASSIVRCASSAPRAGMPPCASSSPRDVRAPCLQERKQKLHALTVHVHCNLRMTLWRYRLT